MKQSLLYLIESLTNYVEEDRTCQDIYEKLEQGDFTEEIDFVESLDEEEVVYLEDVLQKEIAYALRAEDETRARELEIIYQVLF